MGILIPRQLTQEQYIKLFSNPVSGITCDFGAVTNMDNINCLQNIRYSKSMILKALEFWYDYNLKFSDKIRKIYHPVLDFTERFQIGLSGIQISIGMIRGYPDSYLFSHRYIKPLSESKYSSQLKLQHKLLQNKLGINMIEFQQGSLQPYHIMHDYEKFGIEFTVFPNEHPYIPRNKISKVGITDKGNIYILHKKKKERCSKG